MYETTLLTLIDRLIYGAVWMMTEPTRTTIMEQSFSYDEEIIIEDMASWCQQALAEYEQEVDRLRAGGELVELEYLCDVFLLNDFERHVIRLLYAFELNPEYERVVSLWKGSQGAHGITAWFAAWTMPGGVTRRELFATLRPSGGLCRFFLEAAASVSGQLAQPLRLRSRVLSFLTGAMLPDPRQLPEGELFLSSEELPEWKGAADRIDFVKKKLCDRQEGLKKPALLYLYGEKGSGRRLCIKTALKQMGRDGYFFDAAALWKLSEFSIDKLSDSIVFEMTLLGLLPVFVLSCSEEEAPELVSWLELLLRRLFQSCTLAVVCADVKYPLELSGCVHTAAALTRQGSQGKEADLYREDTQSVAIYYLPERPMTLSETQEYWEEKKRQYGLSKQFRCDWMAGKFKLTRGQIDQAMAQAELWQEMSSKEDARELSMERVTKECYEVLQHHMGKKARRVQAKYRMEDLILPKRQKKKLMEAINQIRYRQTVFEAWGFQDMMSYGRGTSMAFVGSPGTGKTMAAQVIASELSMELYKVELSGIVSKYIGETEKNLEEIFEQARKSQVILFFDEADALFSKRSEGKDSNDKYSNMEASCLLQQMEAYDGITILATNLFHHFDEAYKRRLKVVVEFPTPQVEDRKLLWHSMLPKQMPVGEIDFDFLAETFELTGSNIRNILLHGAFLAAAKNKPMDMEELLPAIANEYGKNGKVLSKEEASEYYYYLE